MHPGAHVRLLARHARVASAMPIGAELFHPRLGRAALRSDVWQWRRGRSARESGLLDVRAGPRRVGRNANSADAHPRVAAEPTPPSASAAPTAQLPASGDCEVFLSADVQTTETDRARGGGGGPPSASTRTRPWASDLKRTWEPAVARADADPTNPAAVACACPRPDDIRSLGWPFP